MNDEFKTLVDDQLSALEWKGRHKEAVLEKIRTGEKAPKKVSVAMMVAILLTLALLGAAVAAGFGIFGQFAEKNAAKDLNALEASAPTYADTVAVEPEQAGFPQAKFTLEQAYYDGETIYLSYSFTGGKPQLTFLPGKPTEEQRKAYTSMENMFPGWEARLDEEENKRVRRLVEENGFAYLEAREQFLGDSVSLKNGIRLEQTEGEQDISAEGSAVGYWKFDTPLPESARNQDHLDLVLVMHRSVNCYYITQEGAWVSSKRLGDTALPATVLRNAQAEALTGSGSFEDYGASISLSCSSIEILANVQLTLHEEWMACWQDYENCFETEDFLEGYVLYADGVPCGQISFSAEDLGKSTLGMKMGYEAPEKASVLIMRPKYTQSGEHAEEEIVMKPASPKPSPVF